MTNQDLSYLNQDPAILMVPNEALNQKECAVEYCSNLVDDTKFTFKWYNKATKEFTCQPCGEDKDLRKCFQNEDCIICRCSLIDFALLPCGHGNV